MFVRHIFVLRARRVCVCMGVCVRERERALWDILSHHTSHSTKYFEDIYGHTHTHNLSKNDRGSKIRTGNEMPMRVPVTIKLLPIDLKMSSTTLYVCVCVCVCVVCVCVCVCVCVRICPQSI